MIEVRPYSEEHMKAAEKALRETIAAKIERTYAIWIGSIALAVLLMLWFGWELPGGRNWARIYMFAFLGAIGGCIVVPLRLRWLRKKLEKDLQALVTKGSSTAGQHDA